MYHEDIARNYFFIGKGKAKKGGQVLVVPDGDPRSQAPGINIPSETPIVARGRPRLAPEPVSHFSLRMARGIPSSTYPGENKAVD